MKCLLTLCLITVAMMPLSAQSMDDNPSNRKPLTCDDSRRLSDYLDVHHVEPTFSIDTWSDEPNFSNFDKNRSLKLKTEALNLDMTWYNDIDGVLNFNINGKHIAVRDDLTVNSLFGNSDEVSFVNIVDRISYYEDMDTLLVNMVNSPCNGLGCGISYTLVFDMTNETYHYFVAYSGNDYPIYRWQNNHQDELYVYLASDYDRYPDKTGEWWFTPYQFREQGNLKPLTDKQGTEYFFSHKQMTTDDSDSNKFLDNAYWFDESLYCFVKS